MAAKLQRIQRELRSLAELAEAPGTGGDQATSQDLGGVHEREREISSVRQGAKR